VDESVTKESIKDIVSSATERLSHELRELIKPVIEETHKSELGIKEVIFSESRKIREEIGYQTMILKTLEDNLSEIQFGEDTGVSSRIEVSVGAEIFGTGAKLILDIDTGKASYKEFLKAMLLAPGIPNKTKEKVEAKLRKFLEAN